jgi:amidase
VINPAERNAIVGFKPTVGLTSRAGVVPESEHQDSVGTFGKTVRDAVYAFDAIYGVDKNDNYTLAQKGRTPKGGYAQFLSTKDALKGAKFGLPWKSFWVHAPDEQKKVLGELIKLIEKAGATIVNGTEITNYQTIVSPDGWNWDYGTSRGYPNESEYTVVKVDFYNNINKYLSELKNTPIKSLKDIIQFNKDNDGSEGGYPYPRGHPAFKSGQDGFLASYATRGKQDKTYFQALGFVQSSTRTGINDALRLASPARRLDGLLVPPDVGQSYQIAAQAGYPVITVPAYVSEESGMPFGLALMQTGFGEEKLIRYGSAIEDLQRSSGTKYKRTRPTWRGYLERNIPVPF